MCLSIISVFCGPSWTKFVYDPEENKPLKIAELSLNSPLKKPNGLKSVSTMLATLQVVLFTL